MSKAKKLREKVSVDEKTADIIREHYRCTTSDEVLDTMCYSNPQFRSHRCNRLEKLEGGETCSYCKGDTKKLCAYSCDISKACLSAFAYRLGIGGEDVHKAIRNNLKKDYEDLVDRIQAELTGDHVIQVEEEVGGEVPEAPESSPEIVEKVPPCPSESCTACHSCPTTGKSLEALESDSEASDDEVYLSVREAAKFCGCSTPNIYGRIKNGTLTAEVINGRKCVPRKQLRKQIKVGNLRRKAK